MIEVRLLDPSDDRSGFKSGNEDLDRFFQKYAGQNQFRHYIGVTWVAVDGSRIVGFVTVSASSIECQDLPKSQKKRLSVYPLPILRLARLAVDESEGGKGIAKQLIKTVLKQASGMKETFGCVGIVVDAKPDAIEFYRRLGFLEMQVVEGFLRDRPIQTPMFLPIDKVPRRS